MFVNERDDERADATIDILPSNVTDPRFAEGTSERSPSPWGPVDALKAEATEPLDQAITYVTSPAGVATLVIACVRVGARAAASIIGAFLQH